MGEDIVGLVIMIAAVVCTALAARRKKARYGGYSDPMKIRFSPFITTGFRRKRPEEDDLYDDDGRINRHWKP